MVKFQFSMINCFIGTSCQWHNRVADVNRRYWNASGGLSGCALCATRGSHVTAPTVVRSTRRNWTCSVALPLNAPLAFSILVDRPFVWQLADRSLWVDCFDSEITWAALQLNATWSYSRMKWSRLVYRPFFYLFASSSFELLTLSVEDEKQVHLLWYRVGPIGNRFTFLGSCFIFPMPAYLQMTTQMEETESLILRTQDLNSRMLEMALGRSKTKTLKPVQTVPASHHDDFLAIAPKGQHSSYTSV